MFFVTVLRHTCLQPCLHLCTSGCSLQDRYLIPSCAHTYCTTNSREYLESPLDPLTGSSPNLLNDLSSARVPIMEDPMQALRQTLAKYSHPSALMEDPMQAFKQGLAKYPHQILYLLPGRTNGIEARTRPRSSQTSPSFAVRTHSGSTR